MHDFAVTFKSVFALACTMLNWTATYVNMCKPFEPRPIVWHL